MNANADSPTPNAQPKRLRVLISAYACEPGKGSEPGVGWNMSKEMAKLHDVWVLTRANNREVIEKELAEHPVKGLHFIYYDLPKWAMWWKKGGRGVQLYYFLWQLLAGTVVKHEEFDCCHHLTFNQYRTISFGYFGKWPLILGPVGGAETIPKPLWGDLETISRAHEFFRILGLDRVILFLLSSVKRGSLTYVFSNPGSKRKVERWVRGKSAVLPAIAINPEDFKNPALRTECSDSQFKLLYAGHAEDWKGLLIFLRSVAELKKEPKLSQVSLLVQLIGVRSSNERRKLNRWITQLDLLNEVEVIDFMPRSELIDLMGQCSLSVYPAFRDSGSMSVLEACALGCPVVCFDTPGQEVFPSDLICKVPALDNYEKTKTAFADKLVWAIEHPEVAERMAEQARKFVLEEMTWANKVKIMSELYFKCIGEKND